MSVALLPCQIELPADSPVLLPHCLLSVFGNRQTNACGLCLTAAVQFTVLDFNCFTSKETGHEYRQFPAVYIVLIGSRLWWQADAFSPTFDTLSIPSGKQHCKFLRRGKSYSFLVTSQRTRITWSSSANGDAWLQFNLIYFPLLWLHTDLKVEIGFTHYFTVIV